MLAIPSMLVTAGVTILAVIFYIVTAWRGGTMRDGHNIAAPAVSRSHPPDRSDAAVVEQSNVSVTLRCHSRKEERVSAEDAEKAQGSLRFIARRSVRGMRANTSSASSALSVSCPLTRSRFRDAVDGDE